jgi:ADP-ribose pyrophosphatase YjhB (NUDIX family)
VLVDYKFCPRCAATLDTVAIPKSSPFLRRKCPACGWIFWNNSRPTAGGLILDDQNRLMLIRRGIEPSLGLWDLPGGFLEPGEHPLDGCIRELLEETGAVVEPLQFHGVFMDTYGPNPDDHTHNTFYICKVVGGDIAAADDAEELAWFAYADIPWTELAFKNVTEAVELWGGKPL